MFNKLFTATILLLSFLFLTSIVQAANLSVRVGQPQSPTNKNNFNLTFVALDILNRPLTVKCFKKSASESIFQQFGSDITLSAGGNTDNCKVDSTIISAEGIYQFYVTAKADSEEVTSSTVLVEHKSSSPSTPGSYSKEKTQACQYKISFKTADDGGKTSKVEVYRSSETNFNADDETKVATVWIGSNMEGSVIIDSPDCSKDYYFAVRAFDAAGNGSGTTGDSVTKTVTTTTTTILTPTPGQGAIPVGDSLASGEVLGEKESSSGSDILGQSSKNNPDGAVSTFSSMLTPVNTFFAFTGIAILIYIIYYLTKKYKIRK